MGNVDTRARQLAMMSLAETRADRKLVELAKYTMDEETMVYTFPSLADYKMLMIEIRKAYKDYPAGLANTRIYLKHRGARTTWWASSPFCVATYVLDASYDTGLIGFVRRCNNPTAFDGTFYLLKNEPLDNSKPFRDILYLEIPNADWAKYYADCNAVITVWGVKR